MNSICVCYWSLWLMNCCMSTLNLIRLLMKSYESSSCASPCFLPDCSLSKALNSDYYNGLSFTMCAIKGLGASSSVVLHEGVKLLSTLMKDR